MGLAGPLHAKILIFCSHLLAFAASPASSAQITIAKPSSGSFGIAFKLSGEIEAGDCGRLKFLLDSSKTTGQVISQIELRSLGGNVSESLCLGRLVRSARLVTVGSSDEAQGLKELCASACQFVWLGGIYRLGDVLVHRPFLPRDGKDIYYHDFEQLLSKNKESIRSYFEEISVPVNVLDFIFNVSSDRVLKLSEGRFDLVLDPIFLEYIIRSCGPKMTPDELSILDFFEEVVASEPNQANQTALKYMRLYRDNWEGCAKGVLAKVQMDAQLGAHP